MHITLEGALFCIATYLTATIAHYIGRGNLLCLNSFKVIFIQKLTLFSAVSYLPCDDIYNTILVEKSASIKDEEALYQNLKKKSREHKLRNNCSQDNTLDIYPAR